MKYTKKDAKETIAAYADMTSYFDESMTQADMYNMLRYRMAFGEAESRCIIAALVLAGAKFSKRILKNVLTISKTYVIISTAKDKKENTKHGRLDKIFCLCWRFCCGVCGLSDYFLVR